MLPGASERPKVRAPRECTPANGGNALRAVVVVLMEFEVVEVVGVLVVLRGL